MNTLTDFDLFLEQELVEVVTVPAGKPRRYCPRRAEKGSVVEAPGQQPLPRDRG
jgi:hypothetical protein